MIIPLGKIAVPVPGTPVSLTAAMPGGRVTPFHAILFEADPDNTGRLYVGRQAMDRTTRVGVMAVIAIPTVNFFPTFSVAVTILLNGFSSDEFWIDADIAGEGPIVTCLVT